MPDLITAPDEQSRCCILDDQGNRCPNKSEFWVGKNDVDDYTHACSAYLEEVTCEGDIVQELNRD